MAMKIFSNCAIFCVKHFRIAVRKLNETDGTPKEDWKRRLSDIHNEIILLKQQVFCTIVLVLMGIKYFLISAHFES